MKLTLTIDLEYNDGYTLLSEIEEAKRRVTDYIEMLNEEGDSEECPKFLRGHLDGSAYPCSMIEPHSTLLPERWSYDVEVSV